MMHLFCQTAMTNLLPSLTLAPLNWLLTLNMNMNVNPEITVHDDMNNVKYRQSDPL